MKSESGNKKKFRECEANEIYANYITYATATTYIDLPYFFTISLSKFGSFSFR